MCYLQIYFHFFFKNRRLMFMYWTAGQRSVERLRESNVGISPVLSGNNVKLSLVLFPNRQIYLEMAW